MPRLRAIMKDIVFIIILLVVMPSLILYLLSLPNGLISTLIYMQFIIIWVQAEISMRQLALYRLQATPIIALRHSPHTSVLVDEDTKATKTVAFIARNLSDNPAFNIMLSRILAEDYRPLHPSSWSNLIRCNIIEYLAPKEEKQLCSTTWRELKQLIKTAKVFEISYNDRYGDWHSTAFVINIDDKTGNVEFMPVIREKGFEEIGILLPALNRIALFLRLYRIPRRIRRQ